MASSTPLHGTRGGPQRWHIYCRVIDNYGDVGVCWRLAADLATRGVQVRLVIDDPRALAWMAPMGHAHVQVLPWPAEGETSAPSAPAELPDVVIEAFGCDPPAACVQAMVQCAQSGAAPPVWINLEYLSAEAYVERSHGLPSPQAGGLTKWFFFPGFTPRTGGLLRETDLAARQRSLHARQWLDHQRIRLQPGERLVSLFCYATPRLPALLQALAARPTLLLLTPGPARAAAQLAVPGLRMQALPWLSQPDYDLLLQACDLNFVRGEDSLVRALWAGKPLVWQAYAQADGVHHGKVQALLDLWQAPSDVARLWQWWNGGPAPFDDTIKPQRDPALMPPPIPHAAPPLPELQPWQHSVQGWRQRLLQQTPLAEQLQAFVRAKCTNAQPPERPHAPAAPLAG